MKDNFTLLRSTFDALLAFPAEDMKKAFRMVGEYAMDDIMPDPEESAAYGLFLSIRPLLDRSKKRSEAGKIGGEANRKQTGSKQEANRSINIKGKSKNIKDKRYIVEDAYEYASVIDYLNSKAGTSFRSRSTDSRKHIRARYEEGYTTQDFYKVIDNKVAEWKGTDMAKYLRPSTLFGSKFESYLNQQAGVGKGGQNFVHSGTDWNALATAVIMAESN